MVDGSGARGMGSRGFFWAHVVFGGSNGGGGNLAGWPGGYDGMSTGPDKGVKVTPELHTTV